MDKSKIQRSDLKKNFLKEIIMRLDFQGVLQMEMEKILFEVKPYLKKKSFNRYEEKVSNQIMNNGENITDLNSQIIYSFVAEAPGYTVKISNTSIILVVNSQVYSPFSDYSDIFKGVVDIYKNQIDFFTVKRFGLRKINFCFVKNRDDIAKYFVLPYYSCKTPLPDFRSLSTKREEHLSDGNSNIRLMHSIGEGRIKDSVYQKVTLDSDIYITNQVQIENIIADQSALNDINEKLFKIYLNTLTDSFIEFLTAEDDFNSDEILGVESNE